MANNRNNTFQESEDFDWDSINGQIGNHASPKAVYENDPSNVKGRSVINGTILFITKKEVTIDLANNTVGTIPTIDLMRVNPDLEVGDSLKLKSSTDADGTVHFALAKTANSSPQRKEISQTDDTSKNTQTGTDAIDAWQRTLDSLESFLKSNSSINWEAYNSFLDLFQNISQLPKVEGSEKEDFDSRLSSLNLVFLDQIDPSSKDDIHNDLFERKESIVSELEVCNTDNPAKDGLQTFLFDSRKKWIGIPKLPEDLEQQLYDRYKNGRKVIQKAIHREQKEEKKSNAQQAEQTQFRIGAVKFYDNNKNFGFLCTNQLRSKNTKLRAEALEDIYIGEVKSYINDNSIVAFKTAYKKSNVYSYDVHVLSATYDDIMLALDYRGAYAKISGYDSKRTKNFNIDVLSHLTAIVLREAKNELFFKVLCEYIESLKVNDRTQAVLELLDCLLARQSFPRIGDLPDLLGKEGYAAYRDKVIERAIASEDWQAMLAVTSNGDLEEDRYRQICSKVIDFPKKDSSEYIAFLRFLDPDILRKIFLSPGLDSMPDSFIEHVFTAESFSPAKVFKDSDDLTDITRILLFCKDEDPSHLDAIKDWTKVVATFETCKKLIGTFVGKYIPIVETESDPVFALFSNEMLRAYTTGMSDDDVYQFLGTIPEDMAMSYVSRYHKGSAIYTNLVEDRWKALVGNLPYTVFDLTAEGDTVKEFTFRREGNTRAYQGEGQLSTLKRALSKEKIIVGYRIKDWKLDLLEKKGLATKAYVWDTMEIEMLLNPCRYSYALQTSGAATDDMEKADDLFWNQIYRLSKHPKIVSRLSSMLPKELNDIIEKISTPHFGNLFRDRSKDDEQFFQAPAETDRGVTDLLKKIEEAPDRDRTLIVAPHNLWGEVAKLVNIRPACQSADWPVLSRSKIEKNPAKNSFIDAVLKRFTDSSVTPLVANLAQHLRDRYLTDDVLAEYADKKLNKGAVCASLSDLDSLDAENCFDRIYFIGCELEGRLNQFNSGTVLNASDFTDKGCWIPMRMAGTNYMILTEEERELLGLDGLPEDISNTWVERRQDGKYDICYNFDYEGAIARLKQRNSNAKVESMKWTAEREKEGISLVFSHDDETFRAGELRVGAISRYRSVYRNTQMQMLCAVAKKEEGTPVIYFLDNGEEIGSVRKHAESLGFSIPAEGSMSEMLSELSRMDKGLLVLPADRFNDVIGLKEFTRYAFVWDHMAVDKCRMMWNGKMPFGDERDKDDESRDSVKNTIDATPKTCLLAAWPIMEYRHRLITANNRESRLYILEPYFDNFPDLEQTWNVARFEPVLWNKRKDYDQSLEDATAIYPNAETPQLAGLGQAHIEKAMETIRKIFIPQYGWNESQMDALPALLSKKKDVLISIPTGGGKSILFQGPALFNSSFTNRLSVVITPLKALMEDQVAKLHDPQLGFYTNVDYLSGDRSQGEIQTIYRKITGGELALLYVTPERFRSRSFLNALETRIRNDNGLEYFVFDEAHCISQWGQEFRPDYLNVMKWLTETKKKYPQVCAALCSATVTKQIQQDIESYLPEIERHGQSEEDYNPIRSHISMNFIPIGEHTDAARINAAVQFIRSCHIDYEKSRMIIFCRTREQCEQTALALEAHLADIRLSKDDDKHSPVGYFHAGMDSEDREETYRLFKEGEISILCATKAFGMGMDIPNIHYVLHYSPPSVLEDYLQEVGRAGRNEKLYHEAGFIEGKTLPTVCLVSKEDFKKAKELLIKSMISWSNLNEMRKAILDYITPLQSIEKTKYNPIVIPNDLWRKDMFDDSYTAFRMGMYWLEKMNRIKMGFLCPAHVNITVLKKDLVIDDEDKSGSISEKHARKVFKYIVSRMKEGEGDRLQVSINDVRTNVKLGNNSVQNAIVICHQKGWLRLEQEMRCSVSMLRNDETDYMLRKIDPSDHFGKYIPRTSEIYTLGIILQAVENLLKGKSIHKEYVIDQNERNSILKSAISAADLQTKSVKTKGKANSYGQTEYMIWYDEGEKNKKNIGLAIAANYHKDLKTKRAKHIFSVLQTVPGVSFKSYLDTKAIEIRQTVSIEDDSWQTYLNDLRYDSVRLLRHILKKNNSGDAKSGSINWADCMVELGIENKGCRYLDNLIYILKILGYIHADSMLPIGIEVNTTDESEFDISSRLRKGSIDIKVKDDFDLMNKMRNMRLAAMNALSGNGKNDMNHFISEYFKCVTFDDFFALVTKYYDENNPEDRKFLDAIRDEAIINEEKRLGDEQREIYNAPIDEDINVLAGPGSGKTHTLTLRCARLIYRENVSPDQILVLAYNRAVVVELRNRLDSLFGRLGLGRSASRVHVHTFAALAKIIYGKGIEEIPLNKWESEFLKRIKEKPAVVRKIMPGIKYIMIDEFQDITQTRLDAMKEFRKIYRGVKFFTIGDKNQSIYGFDKKIDDIPESTSPDYYYNQLKNEIKPHEYSMKTNYRSFPKILEAAAVHLQNSKEAPLPCSYMKKNEPSSDYVRIINWTKGEKNWDEELTSLVEHAKKTMSETDKVKRIEDIAIFFRTNNEVYRGYERVKHLNLSDVRIRIQGASACELYRVREIYTVLDYLRKNSDSQIVIQNSETQRKMRQYIEDLMSAHQNWDRFYLDFAYTMILDYLDFAAAEDENFTYGQMADALIEMSSGDDGQIYKIYDRYEDKRIDQRRQLNIILTTMHKVKGLEFDAVIVTPSSASLPFHPGKGSVDADSELSAEEREELEEEKRLQYVAYTRARKILWAYRFKREAALDRMEKMEKIDARLGYSDSNGIDKFELSYLAREKNFAINDYIDNNVAKNDPLTLKGYKNERDSYYGRTYIESNYYLQHSGNMVGHMSKGSGIVKEINYKLIHNELNDVPTLYSIFVNEVFVWTFEDTRKYDEAHNTDFSANWSVEAKKKGYIYVVDFAGYAKDGKEFRRVAAASPQPVSTQPVTQVATQSVPSPSEIGTVMSRIEFYNGQSSSGRPDLRSKVYFKDGAPTDAYIDKELKSTYKHGDVLDKTADLKRFIITKKISQVGNEYYLLSLKQ